MTQKFQSTFFGGLDVEFEHDAQIGAMTNFAIGGRADVLVTPHSTDALSLLMRRCHNSGTPIRILGKGQNLLVDDIGVEGVIVKLDADCFKTHTFKRNEQKNTLHYVTYTVTLWNYPHSRNVHYRQRMFYEPQCQD